MKKLIAWTLLLAMVLAVFAGCNNNDTPATAESLIGDAKSYVYNMYKDKAGKASRDFKLVGVVKVGEFSYDITWTTDAAEENVKVGAVENGIVVVDVNEDYAGEEDLKFTMTGKLTAGEKTETIELNYFIPGVPATTGGPVWADAPTAGSSYKFALVQAERGETLFFTGEMSGYYLATSTSPVDAVDVTVEEVEGGFHLSFLKAGVKTYIDIIPRADNAAKVNVVLTEEPTAVFTWDAERKTMTAKVGEATWYLGTYGTYNTISASDVSYIEDVSKIGVSQFPATFCTINFQTTIIDAPAAGTTGKFFLTQAERGETLYFTGEMSGYYLATSTNPCAGVDVTIEEVEGGYRMFFMKAGVKTYIDIIPRADNPAKVNVVLTEAPAAVFTWDAERKTMTAKVGEATWYLGTYGTYNTISASDVSYIEDVSKIGVSQFPAGFCALVYNFTPAEGQPVVDTPYHFALVQAERGETLYFTGEMNGYYLATSTNPANAVNVSIEEVEGGYRMFFDKAGVKTYIDIIPRADNPAKVNVVLTEAPAAVFTWDAERKTMTAAVGESTWYLGTYGTYNTISASDVSYIADVSKIGVSQFPTVFGTGSIAY